MCVLHGCLVQIPGNPIVSDECRQLLVHLLQRDPGARISFTDFFNHPFIDLDHFPSQDSMEKAVRKDLALQLCLFSIIKTYAHYSARMSPETTHKLMRFYMEVLILARHYTSVHTISFCFFELLPTGCIGYVHIRLQTFTCARCCVCVSV